MYKNEKIFGEKKLFSMKKKYKRLLFWPHHEQAVQPQYHFAIFLSKFLNRKF